MEAANTAPGSQGPLHPNRGRPLPPCMPPAPALGRGASAPLPLIPRPRRCCVRRAERPPRRGALLLRAR